MRLSVVEELLIARLLDSVRVRATLGVLGVRARGRVGEQVVSSAAIIAAVGVGIIAVSVATAAVNLVASQVVQVVVEVGDCSIVGEKVVSVAVRSLEGGCDELSISRATQSGTGVIGVVQLVVAALTTAIVSPVVTVVACLLGSTGGGNSIVGVVDANIVSKGLDTSRGEEGINVVFG